MVAQNRLTNEGGFSEHREARGGTLAEGKSVTGPSFDDAPRRAAVNSGYMTAI